MGVQFPNGFPPDAVDMITKLLNKDPHQRIGCQEPEGSSGGGGGSDGSSKSSRPGFIEEESLRQFKAHPYLCWLAKVNRLFEASDCQPVEHGAGTRHAARGVRRALVFPGAH